jgi:hypothetical protein
LEGPQLLMECRRSDSISPLPRCWLRIAGKLWMTFRILSDHDTGERRELTLEGWRVALDRAQSYHDGCSTLLQQGVEYRESLTLV